MQRYAQLKQFEKGALLMSLSSLCVAFFGFFAKLAMGFSLSLSLVVFLRFSIPFFLILPFLFYKGTFKHLNISSSLLLQLLRAFCVIVSQYSLFYYLTKASLLDATMLWNTGPIFMPFIGRVFFKHRIGKTTIMSGLLGLIGVVCILQPRAGIFNFYSFWGLLSGFSMAFSQVLYGLNREEERADVNLFCFFLFTSLLSLIVLLIREFGVSTFVLGEVSLLFTTGIAPPLIFLLLAAGTIGNQALRGIAYTYAKPSSLAPFIYLAVVLSGMIDWAYFELVPNFDQIIGIIIILFSSTMRILYTSKT